jgi:hypothetical protein
MVKSPRGIVQPAAPIPGLEAARATPADRAQQCIQSDSFMASATTRCQPAAGSAVSCSLPKKNGLVYVGSVDTGFK